MSDSERQTASPFRFSLQTKLVAMVLACVVAPLVAVGYYLLRRNEEILDDKIRENLSSQLLRKGSEVEDWMRERLRDAPRFSASFVVFEGVDALNRPGDSTRARRDLEDYLSSLLGHHRASYKALFLVNTRGDVLASSGPETLEDWARAFVAHGPASSVITPLRRSEALGRPTQLVLQPIDKGTRRVGYFVGRLDLGELEAHLGPPASDLTLVFWLLDQNGRVLAKAGKVLEEPGSESFPVPPNEGTYPEDAMAEAEFPGLGKTIYRLHRLEGRTDGYMAVTVPFTLAYAPLAEARVRLLKWGIPAAGLIFALTFLAARQTLRPILLLSEGAKRVSAGELDVYLPVRGRDEIAELTRAFNEMARKVREGRQSLEEARDQLARTNEGLKEANRTLEALAITDGLTGLYNHRHFQETLDKEIRRCDREGRSLSLLLLDLDHFKQYNDRWGHTEGDAALRRVAGQVMKSIRSTDLAFRYGGEELAVLLPSCSKEQAAEVAEKIRTAVASQAQRPGRFGRRVTISVGVATFPEDGRVARGLVDTSDAALYAAKSQGRDRVVVAGLAVVAKPKSETAG